MPPARILPVVLCGVWLCASAMAAAAAERIQTIKLRGGDLQLVNNDEEKPKVVINGKEFLFMPKTVAHKKTFKLSDRDVVILATLEGTREPDEIRVFTLTTDGRAEEIQAPGFRFGRASLGMRQKGDAVHFDLGYWRELKIDAVLSPKGLQVSRRGVARPAYDARDCKWLFDTPLRECVNSPAPCDLIGFGLATTLRLWDLDKNPRWNVAETRFDATCAAACKTRQRPSYSQFAKNICGP